MPSSNGESNRDKVLRGEAVKVTDDRLREMQRICVANEGVGYESFHWHWAAVVNELIARRADETQPAASKPLTQRVEEGMRLRHAAVEQATDKLGTARDMAYLSHLDRGELLVEIERLRARSGVETKPPLGQEPWRLGLPVITVQMLADFGQEGFFERTDEPKPGIDGVIWSQAAVDFACLLQGLRKDRLAVEPSESRAFTMKEAFGLTEKASERQCSWGCHYAGAQFIRYAACTVHGASSSENGSA